MRSSWTLLLWIVGLTLLAGGAWAQTGPEPGEGVPDAAADVALAPLVLPMIDEFAPAAGLEPIVGPSVMAGFEVTSTQKAGLLTPSYRFTPNLALKARVPLIFERTYTYWGTEAKGSGLGDIGVDAEYNRPLSPGLELRAMASVKLPTGDDEKVETIDGFDYATPLGTGSTDWFGRVQLARSGANFQWLVAALYRTNGTSETITDFGSSTATTTTDQGDQFVGSAFARARATGSWWVHLGVSAATLADGSVEVTYSDGSPTGNWDLVTAGSLIDLYPGLSYSMGKWSPFVGARIPVATSYDDPLADESRDAAFIVQVSFNPARLAQ